MMRGGHKQRGFSLVEMVVVVSILLVVAAIAVPSMMEAMYDMRLRNSANNLAGLMQQARMMAIHDNTYYPVKSVVNGGNTIFFVDTTALSASPSRIANTSYNSSFPTLQLGTGINKTFTNPDTAGTSKPWNFTAMALSTKPMWGPMGMPCAMSSGRCVTSSTGASGSFTAGYMIILTDNRTFGSHGYMSVTASPGGRVSVWRWTGSAWQ